ncbi:hypothetical protein SAMN06265373_106210 [Shimia sagamensis]|uniref:Transposase n=1 Tax=Shimia sagamensis TaxID=1566352 RepID=A0ABY1PAC7_9RHOB|nr:hypothetical protein SAMN06265373_106210 [Shimia sagamensis]
MIAPIASILRLKGASFCTSAIQTQYRRYADVQKSPKLALLERRAFPLPAAGSAPHEMQDIGG